MKVKLLAIVGIPFRFLFFLAIGLLLAIFFPSELKKNPFGLRWVLTSEVQGGRKFV